MPITIVRERYIKMAIVLAVELLHDFIFLYWFQNLLTYSALYFCDIETAELPVFICSWLGIPVITIVPAPTAGF